MNRSPNNQQNLCVLNYDLEQKIKFSLFEMYSKKLLMILRYQAQTRIECLLGLYFLLDSEGLM